MMGFKFKNTIPNSSYVSLAKELQVWGGKILKFLDLDVSIKY